MKTVNRAECTADILLLTYKYLYTYDNLIYIYCMLLIYI